MVLLAKIALGLGGTIAVAGAYTFREGVIRVDADESRAGGSHTHFWVPAAVIPLTLHLIPDRQLDKVTCRARPWLPTFRAMTKELKKYHAPELIDARGADKNVHVRTHNGKLLIDVDESGQRVHVICPIAHWKTSPSNSTEPRRQSERAR